MRLTSDTRSLTGLRGLAACWVVVYHMHEFDPMRGPGATLIRHGYLAVDIFFVLSGFVMALSYSRLFDAGFTARAFAVFMTRRIARVYPLYIVMTCIAAIPPLLDVLHRTASGRAFVTMLAANALMIQHWGVDYSFDAPAWSISTEFFAYLVFPLLGAIFLRGRASAASAGTLVAFAAIVLVSLQVSPPVDTTPRQGPLDVSWVSPPWSLLRCVAGFSIGLATYRLATSRRDTAPMTGRALSIAPPVALAILLVPRTDLLFVALVPFVLLHLATAGASRFGRFLSSRPLMLLGDLSFSIYLWHYLLIAWLLPPIAHATRDALPPTASGIAAEAVFWVVLLGLSACSYRLIEQIGRRWIRSWEKSMFPTEDRMLAGRAG